MFKYKRIKETEEAEIDLQSILTDELLRLHTAVTIELVIRKVPHDEIYGKD